ncbi:MAG: serine hydrolase domain-containing protein [Planctomycetota bacterium]
MSTQRNTTGVVFLTIVLSLGGRTEVLHAGSKDIVEVLEPIRKKYALPALAGAVILQGQTTVWGATGFRKDGNDVKVTSDDKFHIGSCTKAMTATIVAMLVERGKLRWDMTLAAALPDIAEDMHADCRNVTLIHLLGHRGGLPPPSQSWPEGKSFMDMHNLPGCAMDQRLSYARMMLHQEPQTRPGAKYVYSNAGYAIAGVIGEQAMNTPWETLMKEMLFDPLGMTTAGFGAMGSPGNIDQPWQHRMEEGELCAIEPGRFSDNPPVIGPGGTVHCSIGDWAKFVTEHLKGAKGPSSLLKPETFKALHTAAFGGYYAGGWRLTKRDWAAGLVFTHTGSNTMNFAVVWMAPKRAFAVLVASNQGGGDVEKACDEACWALIKEFLLKEESGKGR